MSTTDYTVVTAAASDGSRLATDVATKLALGFEPFGSPLIAGDKLVQVMTKTNAVLVTYTADGAITTTAGLKIISKTSAAAMTLAAPTVDGVEISLIAGTAFAHVITSTDKIDDGVTGGAKDTITLGAFVGACATLISLSGKWVLKSKSVATVAAV